MEKKEAKKRIEKLKEAINNYRRAYHNLEDQEISEEALDSLKHELYLLEQEFPEFITADSPTQRVEGRPLEKFEKVEHRTPMLSIEDIFSEEEFLNWQRYLAKLAGRQDLEFYVEYKIDGFAVSLIYENGMLARGATRGDGRFGEDVTRNLKTIQSIPRLIKEGKMPEGMFFKKNIEIRGEVYMTKKDFERFNEEAEASGQKTYSNPRNLAAGSIRQLDPLLAARRPLNFLAYSVADDIGQKKHSQEHKALFALGFSAFPGMVCRSGDEVINYWRSVAKERDKIPYNIDGVVITVNDKVLLDRLGVAGKSQRGVRAFKFSPKQATTRVLDIKGQVGRTGVVTPVAHLQPVLIEGVTVTRATLHNEDEIKRLGVRIGDTVIIERAGDVIPAIVKVLPELRTGRETEFRFPKSCPACGKDLVRPAGESAWRCVNPDCRAKKRENLYYLVSKKAFDVQGMGPKIIDKLSDENLITEAPDIFALEEGDLVPLERFAEKSAKNLVEAVKKSKKISLQRFINALGIRHVGEETAFLLAEHFLDLKKLQGANIEELRRISGIGEKVAESIYLWFKDEKNARMLRDLERAGVKITHPLKTKNKLGGKTFVFTGTLSFSREEAEQKVKIMGGKTSSSVSRATDYLVAGEEPGSKMEKARKFGVKIIDEKEFRELIK